MMYQLRLSNFALKVFIICKIKRVGDKNTVKVPLDGWVRHNKTSFMRLVHISAINSGC